MPLLDYDVTKQTNDEFFKIVNEADRKNWAMAAGCEREFASLVTGHAYTMLGAV